MAVRGLVDMASAQDLLLHVATGMVATGMETSGWEQLLVA